MVGNMLPCLAMATPKCRVRVDMMDSLQRRPQLELAATLLHDQVLRHAA